MKLYQVLFITIIAVILVLLILAILFSVLKKRKNKSNTSKLIENVILALGGKDNIIEINSKGSRVSVKLNDPSKFDENLFKEIGITSIIYMSNKITFVAGSLANDIYLSLRK